MLAAIEGDGLRAMRDRAILAIGMAAALRWSEIVALTVDHVGLVSEGLRLTIPRSKTDQADQGAFIAIPDGSRIRPKALLLAWMAASGHRDGPLFRRLSRTDGLAAAPMSDRAAGATACRCGRLPVLPQGGLLTTLTPSGTVLADQRQLASAIIRRRGKFAELTGQKSVAASTRNRSFCGW